MLRASLVLALALTAAVPAAAHAATTPPHLIGGKLTAKRIVTPQSTFVSFGAVVRLDRAVTARERTRLGLITAPWNHRQQVAGGATLPDALFGGTSLGRIGTPRRHCYVAEVAQVRRHTQLRYGSTWRLAIHDGRQALGKGLRLHARDASTTTERTQAEALGCYAG